MISLSYGCQLAINLKSSHKQTQAWTGVKCMVLVKLSLLFYIERKKISKRFLSRLHLLPICLLYDISQVTWYKPRMSVVVLTSGRLYSYSVCIHYLIVKVYTAYHCTSSFGVYNYCDIRLKIKIYFLLVLHYSLNCYGII